MPISLNCPLSNKPIPHFVCGVSVVFVFNPSGADAEKRKAIPKKGGTGDGGAKAKEGQITKPLLNVLFLVLSGSRSAHVRGGGAITPNKKGRV